MSRIFILSYNSGLKRIIGNIENYHGLDSLCNCRKKHGIEKNCNQQHTLYYNSTENKFQSEIITDSKIIIIHDFSYFTEIEKFIITDSDYLLHHTSGDGDVTSYSEKFGSNKKKGMHEEDDRYLYAPVFRKIFDNNIPPQNKADEILNFLFPDEEKKRNTDLTLRHSHWEQNLTPTMKQ